MLREIYFGVAAEIAAIVSELLGKRQFCDLSPNEQDAVFAQAQAKYMNKYVLKTRKTGLQPPG
jgi:hypothetical protein